MRFFLKIFLLIFLLTGFLYSQSLNTEKYIDQADAMMQASTKLEQYIQNSYEESSLSDIKLSDYKKVFLNEYNQLTSIESNLKLQLSGLEESLKQYVSLNDNKRNHDLLGNNFIYRAVSNNQPNKQTTEEDQDYRTIKFHSKIIQKRYNHLVESYFETKQALSYVSDTKKRISGDLDFISDIRIKARNRDFFTKGDFLGYYNSWKQGINEIEYNVSFISLLKYIGSVFFIFCIYKLCSVAFYLSLKSARTRLIRYRAIISSLSFFLRIVWNVLIATVLVIVLGRLFQLYKIEEFFVAYSICVYFILQNCLIIFLRSLKISLSSRQVFWFKSYAFILMLLIFVQGVNFFSAVTLIQPIFGHNGTPIISLIIGIILLFVSIIIFSGLGKVTKTRAVSFLKIFILLFSIVYIALTFIGLGSLAIGVLVNLLQIFVVLIVIYSIYSVLIIFLYYITSKIISKQSYRAVFLSRLRDYKNESVAEYWVRVLIKLVCGILGLVVALMILGVPYQEINDFFYAIFFNGIKISGNNYFAIFELLKSFLVLVVGLGVTKFIEKIFSNNVLPYTSIDTGTQKAISAVIWYVGLLVTIIFFIASLGISGTALAFIISGLSVGIGFALQGLMKNFFSGFMLLIERPIKIGDWIDLDGDICKVKKIKLRSTVVEDFNLNVNIIPNSLFMTQTIKNETFNPITRLNIDISVDLKQDVTSIIKALEDIAHSNERVLNIPQAFVTFRGYSKYTLDFVLRAYCYRTEKLKVESHLREVIIARFNEQGIDIPINTSKIILDKEV